MPDGRDTIKPMTQWRGEALSLFSRRIEYEVGFPKTKLRWDTDPTWYINSRTPHIKMHIYHDAIADPNLLLRNDVYAILVAMKERLESENIKKHIVIPVIVFSFVGERHGRVLSAYFDGEHLVIQTSRLYRFFTTDTDSWNFFLRYLAAGVSEEESTTSL